MSYRRTSSRHTLMLVVFRRAHLSIKLDPDLFEQLVQPSGIALGAAPHGAMRIHRHCARRVSAMSGSRTRPVETKVNCSEVDDNEIVYRATLRVFGVVDELAREAGCQVKTA